MTRYYIASEPGRCHEVRAHCLDDVVYFSNLTYGKTRLITDNPDSKFLSNRKLSALSELPPNFAKAREGAAK